MALRTDNALALFRSMLRIRRIEEALAHRYAEQEIRCPMHLCIGQEAIAVGVCSALRKDDPVFSNHRAHGHYLAKGGDLNRMIAEIYGRSTGCCGGRGGSMHLIDLNVGFMGSTPIVGGTVPIAVGTAWASQMQNTGRVSVAFFGDGCFEEGVLHESMNFAALKKLPVIFVCENNSYSVYTHLRERQPDRPMHVVAAAYGLNAVAGDGNDVQNVFAISREAIKRARSGEGPQFIELDTYRWREHCGPNFDDELNYRTQEEITEGQGRCPVARMQLYLVQTGICSENEVTCMEKEIDKEIKSAFEFALSSPTPTYNDSVGRIYAA